MFLGIYKTYFSGKGRLNLPKKFRKELGREETTYIVMGPDGEIWGLNSEKWLQEAESRLKVPLTEKKGRLQRREFFSKAEECLLDAQGRFVLPPQFVEHASLKDEILLIGAGDHFEIWQPKRWNKRSSSLNK